MNPEERQRRELEIRDSVVDAPCHCCEDKDAKFLLQQLDAARALLAKQIWAGNAVAWSAEQEREACAKVAENCDWLGGTDIGKFSSLRKTIATAIRARGTPIETIESPIAAPKDGET